jgi:hypothetical protein
MRFNCTPSTATRSIDSNLLEVKRGKGKSMTITLDAKNLSLKNVQSLLKLTEQLNDSFTSLLSLTNITEFEHQELQIIRNIYHEYYSEGVVVCPINSERL